jgi:Recombinase zinc beta ribbon domain
LLVFTRWRPRAFRLLLRPHSVVNRRSVAGRTVGSHRSASAVPPLRPEQEARRVGAGPTAGPARERVAAASRPRVASRGMTHSGRRHTNRLAEWRALYLRSTNGQVWGHPARGTESKYLLVALAKCGVCGSGMSVRSREHGKRRACYYVCTGYHLRGQHVCSNRYELPMEDTNTAVLTAVGEQVLSPDMLEAAIDRAVVRLAMPRREDDDGAERLRDEGRMIEEQLERLTAALAEGRGSMSTRGHSAA